MNEPASKLLRFLEGSAPSGLVSTYLFGSVARGAEHRESDIDVGVLVDRVQYPTRASRNELRIGLSAELVHVLSHDRVDVVVLNDAPPELGRHVVTCGERLHCRDDEADHAFVRDVQLRAADLAPFLRRMRRIKLEALRS